MNIILIDDHTLFRSGIENMLTSLDAKTEIQSFCNCAEALESATSVPKIDVILLDYNIPGSSTTDNIHSVSEYFENAKIIILSGEEEPAKVITAIDHGAAGFIPKSSEPHILIAALQLVLAGGVYLPQQVLRLQSIAPQIVEEKSINDSIADNPLDNLTKRQFEVLMYMIDGKNNKTIAREIDLSLGTVKAHLSSAYSSLGVSNRTEAVVLASKYLNNQAIKPNLETH